MKVTNTQSPRALQKQQIAQIRQKFEGFIGEDVHIAFGPHVLDTQLRDVVQARQADVINLPDKRTDSQGKAYTPALFTLMCGDAGKLHFVLEDVRNVVVTTSGVSIIMDGDLRVTVSKW